MTFAEQITLLAIDPKTGKFHALPKRSLEIGLAGAFVLEMTFRGIIDADSEKIIVIEETVPNRPLLNSALQVLFEANREIPLQKAIARLALQGSMLVDRTLQRLVEQGVLERKDKVWFVTRKQPVYTQADDEPYRETIRQIRQLVLDAEAIPSPKEAALLGLVNACRLQRTIFSEEERSNFENRFRQLGQMDLVGHAIVEAVRAAREKDLVELAGE